MQVMLILICPLDLLALHVPRQISGADRLSYYYVWILI